MKQRIVFRGISLLLPALPDAIHFKSATQKSAGKLPIVAAILNRQPKANNARTLSSCFPGRFW